jgi:hypothetical protein
VCSNPGLDVSIVGQENEAQSVQPIQAIPPSPPKKRKNRKRTTPIVDDEIQRNIRKHQLPGFEHMELDEKNKPHRLGETDTRRLKKKLLLTLDEAETNNQIIPLPLKQTLAIEFCGVTPEDVTEDRLNIRNVNNDKEA